MKLFLVALLFIGCGDSNRVPPPLGDLVDTENCEVVDSSSWGGVIVCPRGGGLFCEQDHEIKIGPRDEDVD